MALSADLIRRTRNAFLAELEVANAATVYQGGYMAAGSWNHGTSASQGRAFAWTKSAHEIPLGFPEPDTTVAAGLLGNTSASPIPKVAFNPKHPAGKGIVERVTVVGASARADFAKRVYATDDGTFTLTRADPDMPVGFVMRWITSTTCDVYFFSMVELYIIAMAGSGQFLMHLGCVTAGAATGNVLTGIVAPCHMKILSVFGIVAVEATDADVVQTINLEIAATNVTGGVITWQFDDAVGAKKSGTAITAANIAHAGDAIDVETVATVAGTVSDPGLLNVYALCETLPGL